MNQRDKTVSEAKKTLYEGDRTVLEGSQTVLATGGEGALYQIPDGRCLHRFSGAYGRIRRACFNPEANRVMLGHEKSERCGEISVWYLDRMFEV